MKRYRFELILGAVFAAVLLAYCSFVSTPTAVPLTILVKWLIPIEVTGISPPAAPSRPRGAEPR